MRLSVKMATKRPATTSYSIRTIAGTLGASTHDDLATSPSLRFRIDRIIGLVFCKVCSVAAVPFLFSPF